MDAPILRLDRHSLPAPHNFPVAEILPGTTRVALEITRGRVKQRLRPIAGRVFLIGTANDCDLVLGDLQFPEAYAYMFVAGSQVSIRRLGAGPELMVCGETVDSCELFHGDLVEFGPFELRVVIDDAPQRPRAEDDEIAVADTIPLEDGIASPIDEVRALLADIRCQRGAGQHALRVYDGVEVSSIAASYAAHRASA
jgi:hypothetical protein